MMKKINLLICIMILLTSFFTEVSAQSVNQQRQKKAKLEREIAIIDKQLAENSSKSSAMLSNLTLVQKKIENRRALVAESEYQIRLLADSIYLKQRKINLLQRRVDTLTAHYSKLVQSAYKNRDSKVWFLYMFSSDNLSQGYRRYAYFKNLSSQMNEEAKEIKSVQEKLNAEKAVLQGMRREAVQVKKSRERELEKLRGEEQEAKRIVSLLNKDKKTYQRQLASKKKQVQALNQEIERLVAEAMKKSPSTSSKSKKPSKPIDYKLAKEFSANKGKLPWPAEGPVVGRFGKQYHPVFKNLELPPNKGIDIAMSKGADVQAVFNGEVVQVVVLPQYNQCVMIQHGNYLTVYCKLKVVNVKVGDKVKTGETIGTIDTINGETELHFEIWKESQPQNPSLWLRK